MDPRVHRLRFAQRCLEDDEPIDFDANRQRRRLAETVPCVVILEASPSEAKAMNSGIHASDSRRTGTLRAHEADAYQRHGDRRQDRVERQQAGQQSAPHLVACLGLVTHRRKGTGMADKSEKMKARLPRGFADRTAEDIRAVEKMTAKIRAVYELYGFEPADQPLIEYTDALGNSCPTRTGPTRACSPSRTTTSSGCRCATT
jgi:hypothetical protein